MKVILSVLAFSVSLTLSADPIKSRVEGIDLSSTPGEDHLVRLQTGEVVFVPWSDTDTLKSFQASLKEKSMLELELTEELELRQARSVEDDGEFEASEDGKVKRSFDPSIVNNESEIFRNMRRDWQNQSQCYNRAHVWAAEEYNRSGVKSEKLFLFFTSRYIRNYRYKWWFHVSPMVKTASGDRVLDRRYTSGPRSINNWTKNFIYSGRTCPTVKKYSDYRNNQSKEDCYLIPVSMYFWQPRDIERRDRTGDEKTSFIKRELEHAYWEAF